MIKSTLLIIALFLCTSAREPGCLKIDIILLADVSASVQGHEPFINAAFSAFASHLPLSEDEVKLGVTVFAESARTTCPLTADLSYLRAHGGVGAASSDGTDIAVGLRAAAEELFTSGRREARRVIILVSDGLHNGSDADVVYNTAMGIKQMGIIVCCVVIADTSCDKALMYNLASPGFYVESSYGTLVDTLKKLDMCL